MEVRKFFISPSNSIREAIRKLDETAKKVLVVVSDKKLVGILTDGDIRRWILKSGDLESTVELVMNQEPIFLFEEEKNKAYEIMRSKSVEGIPILNTNLEVIDLLFWNDSTSLREKQYKKKKIPVVIMAGGKGSRLYPYTNVIPKPLIPIGDIPIIERIMNQFYKYGFEDFYITMHYKKEMIKAYFTKEYPYQITFLEEEVPRGTAASLRMLKERLQGNFVVSNCDILLDINYEELLVFHQENKNKITLATALKGYEIPYGVLSLGENGAVLSIEEKPKLEYLINTGIYVINQEVLSYIPNETQYDMTDLIKSCIEKKDRVGAYPVMDSSWLDMGEWNELWRMEERLQE